MFKMLIMLNVVGTYYAQNYANIIYLTLFSVPLHTASSANHHTSPPLLALSSADQLLASGGKNYTRHCVSYHCSLGCVHK